MVDTILEEWQELSNDFKQLESIKKTYQQKLEEIVKYQNECEKQINHQRYRIAILRKSSKNLSPERLNSLEEEMLKREIQLQDIQDMLPKPSDLYLRTVLGNVNVSILNKDEKLKYKSDYEKFKLIMSGVLFILGLLNIWYISRIFERIFLFIIVWYYCTLSIRESILKVNGSKIKGWWRFHHILTTISAAILLIWPESRTWELFRTKFIVLTVYITFVQYLQYRYQNGVLYRLKALGERHNMDITIDGFHSWMWHGLSFLFPFLFLVYASQLYLAINLYQLSYLSNATWHVSVSSLLFSILALGNIITTLMTIKKKFHKNFMLKYRILSQKLHKTLSGDINDKNKK